MSAHDQTYEKRTQSTALLEKRLNINSTCSDGDFFAWQKKCFSVKPGFNILDIGCGNGAQLKIFDELTNGSFTALAIDASETSILAVKNHFSSTKVEALAYDMNNIEKLCQEKFLENTFDFAQSSYAVYYANDPVSVLMQIKRCLKPHGVMSITVPTQPHEMVNFISKICEIPEQVRKTISFGADYLIPFAKSELKNLKIDGFTSTLTFSNSDSFFSMWESTTYFRPDFKEDVLKALELHFQKFKEIKFQKNSLMVTGSKF